MCVCRFLHCDLPSLISRENNVVPVKQYTSSLQQLIWMDLRCYCCCVCVYYTYKIQFQKGERNNNGDFSASNDALLFARVVQVCACVVCVCELNFFYLFLSRALTDIQFCDFKRLRAKIVAPANR